MMIFTKDGTWVRAIIWFGHKTNHAEYVCRYGDWSEEWKTSHISELRVSGGRAEIIDSAIEQRNRP